MSKKEVRYEWKNFLLEDNMEYSLEEAVEKVKMAVGFFKEKKVRMTIDFLLNPNEFDKKYHLMNKEKSYYVQQFLILVRMEKSLFRLMLII